MKQYTHTSVVLLILLGLMLALGLTACQSATGQTDEGTGASRDTSATDATPIATAVPGEPATEAPTASPAAPASESTTGESAEAETSTPRTFQIVQEQSEARFLIDEILLGNPNTVIGATSQVSGEIIVNPAEPTQAQISPIQVNARDLTTDDDRRNGAIRRFILQSNQDEYQFIVFQPTAIEGLPDSVTIGEPFEFRVTGDLKIRDITNPVTFDMTITANSEDELSGSGATTVLRSDYGLNIPNVPSVAGVSEEVRLEVDFIAALVEAETHQTQDQPTLTCDDNLEPTVSNPAGPFYKSGAPERSVLVEPGMAGTRLILTGQVLTTDCQPVAGAVLDFWQADDQGEYDNVGFTLRGKQFTDEMGRYRLETIVPARYPGRPPHIHVKVNAPDGPVLTTQIYFEGQPGNESDAMVRPSLTMPLTDTADGSKAATFNFVLASE